MEVPVCPICGSTTIKRLARKGSHKGKEFYGCSRYPTCKGIVNIPRTEQNPSSDDHEEVDQNNNLGLESEVEEVKTPLTEKQKFVLKNLRDQILNISTNNRSVRLNHIYDIWAFDLHSLIEPFGSNYLNDIIESALQRKPKIKLLSLNPNEEEICRLSSKLNKLFQSVREIEVEKGLYDLNIGFPFLCGLTREGKVVQGPVLLMPARLEKYFPKRGAPQWVITQEKGVPITFNKTLLMALSKYNGNAINNDIYELEIPEELYGKKNFMQWVSSTLNEHGVPCELSEDAYDDEIDRLPQFKMNELPETFSPGILKVHQCAVLGHFPQANSGILRDYEFFLSASQEDISGLLPIIDTDIDILDESSNRVFVSDNNKESENSHDSIPTCLDQIPEKDNVFLLEADGSQEKIILSLYDKNSPGIVVWGPPGTGKSQTIVNLIGHALGRKMTCLVVCQKRTALDVVHDRLDSLGLSRHIAVVHDSRKDRKDLYSKLEDHTIIKEDIEISNESYEGLSKKIDENTNKLQDVYRTLYKANGKKLPPIELYRNSRSDQILKFDLPDSCKSLDAELLDKLISELNQYQQIAHELIPKHPWRLRKSFSEYGPMDLSGIMRSIDEHLNLQNVSWSVFLDRKFPVFS